MSIDPVALVFLLVLAGIVVSYPSTTRALVLESLSLLDELAETWSESLISWESTIQGWCDALVVWDLPGGKHATVRKRFERAIGNLLYGCLGATTVAAEAAILALTYLALFHREVGAGAIDPVVLLGAGLLASLLYWGATLPDLFGWTDLAHQPSSSTAYKATAVSMNVLLLGVLGLAGWYRDQLLGAGQLQGQALATLEDRLAQLRLWLLVPTAVLTGITAIFAARFIHRAITVILALLLVPIRLFAACARGAARSLGWGARTSRRLLKVASRAEGEAAKRMRSWENDATSHSDDAPEGGGSDVLAAKDERDNGYGRERRSKPLRR